MKRRHLSLILAAALALGLLTGCGGGAKTESSNSYAMDMAPAEEVWVESPAAAESGITGDTTSIQNPSGEQKLIIRANIYAETEDLDPLLEALSGQIAALGGYTERQELQNGSAYSTYRYRSAYLTVRIPAARLGEFTQALEGQSNVVSYTETSDDVTLTYVDTQSRMTALQTEQERLLELLSQAENMTDLLEIEARLTDVRYELESVTSRLRVLDNQVDYATVELSIEEVRAYTPVAEQTLWQRIASGFTGNLRDIGDGLLDTLVWALTYSPQLLVTAGICFLVFRLLKKLSKRRKQRYQPQTPKPRPDEPQA